MSEIPYWIILFGAIWAFSEADRKTPEKIIFALTTAIIFLYGVVDWELVLKCR